MSNIEQLAALLREEGGRQPAIRWCRFKPPVPARHSSASTALVEMPFGFTTWPDISVRTNLFSVYRHKGWMENTRAILALRTWRLSTSVKCAAFSRRALIFWEATPL